MTDLVPIEPEPVADLGDAKVIPPRYTGTYVDCVILGSLDYLMFYAGQRGHQPQAQKETK